MVQDSATWCNKVQEGATWCNMVQQLCGDYAFFGEHFWPKFGGGGHENILVDWGGGSGGGGGCQIICILNQGGDPMTVELATHTGALLETKVC